MFLGLDLSLTSSGICRLITPGAYDAVAVGSKTLKGMERIRLIIDGLKRVVGDDPELFTLAAVEGYALAAPGHKFYQAELCGVVKWHLEEWKIPYVVVPPKHLKQFATGNGAADKIQVCEAVLLTYGANFLKEYSPTKKKPDPPADWAGWEKNWETDQADAYVLANIAALYADAWTEAPTLDQRGVIAAIRQDPMGVLTSKSKERNAARKQAGPLRRH